MRTLKRPSHLIYTQRKFFDRITKFHSSKGTFVAPDPVEVPTDTIRNLAEFFCRHRNITVLSGAGCSTESGIPDYRSPTHGSYSKGHKPTTYAEFTRSHVVRQRDRKSVV